MLILTPFVITLLFIIFWMIRNRDSGGCLPVICYSVAICVFTVSLCGMEGCSTEDSSEDEDEDAASLLQAVPASGEEDDTNYNYRVGETSVVGEYSANGYGLYDLAGNVWEWCLDGVEDYKELPNPLGGVSNNTFSNYHEIATDFTKVTSFRILRGGSCFSREEDVRLTVRAAQVPNLASGGGGRCSLKCLHILIIHHRYYIYL